MAEVIDKPNVQPWVMSPQEEQLCRTTDASFEWLCRLPSAFLRQFAGKWIAVRDCRIVAVADGLDNLRNQLSNGDLASVIIHRVEQPGKVIYR
jgi:hypothetical protein